MIACILTHVIHHNVLSCLLRKFASSTEVFMQEGREGVRERWREDRGGERGEGKKNRGGERREGGGGGGKEGDGERERERERLEGERERDMVEAVDIT